MTVLKLTKYQKGAVNMQTKRLTVEEIEKKLGIDKVQPIRLTPSDEADMIDKEDEMRDWYEDELREFFQQGSRTD